jgi:Tfp pilus assembly protein PilX
MVRSRGIILLSVVIIFFTLSLIGLSLFSFYLSMELTVRKMIDETKSLYLAESGLAAAIFFLRTQQELIEKQEASSGKVPLEDGSYEFKIDLLNSLITATGYRNKSQRTIQVKYKAL